MKKLTNKAAQKPSRNDYGIQFEDSASFPNWLDFPSSISACLGTYQVSQSVSHAWG